MQGGVGVVLHMDCYIDITGLNVSRSHHFVPNCGRAFTNKHGNMLYECTGRFALGSADSGHRNESLCSNICCVKNR